MRGHTGYCSRFFIREHWRIAEFIAADRSAKPYRCTGRLLLPDDVFLSIHDHSLESAT